MKSFMFKSYMKKLTYITILFSLLFATDIDLPLSFYDYTAISIDGDTVHMKEFNGKKILIVNVASKCGYTSQYTDLQILHEKYSDHISVLGFPSNNFFRQEPGTNEEIQKFCKREFGVTFPMFEKIHVKGKKQHPIYKWLSNKKLNGWNDKVPSWNFYKYLIDEKGRLIEYFRPNINPLDILITHPINTMDSIKLNLE